LAHVRLSSLTECDVSSQAYPDDRLPTMQNGGVFACRRASWTPGWLADLPGAPLRRRGFNFAPRTVEPEIPLSPLGRAADDRLHDLRFHWQVKVMRMFAIPINDRGVAIRESDDNENARTGAVLAC
jgi:hypothetical protein